MTNKRPLGLPSVKLIVIAAVAGIVAGAAAVYVKETGSGKVETAAAQQCEGVGPGIEAVKAFARGEVAAMVAADNPRPIVGMSFVDDLEKPLSLQSFRGKTLLVNLWATWCVPCREEMPALNALQQARGGDDFQVVAINIDTGDAGKPRDFLNETGVDKLGLYRDSSMGVFNTMKKEGLAFGLPATMLVEEKGCLLGSMNGPAAWDSPEALALVDAAIAR